LLWPAARAADASTQADARSGQRQAEPAATGQPEGGRGPEAGETEPADDDLSALAFPKSIGMRWPFLVAFAVLGGVFLAVCTRAMILRPQPRRPDPWAAAFPALVIADLGVLIVSTRVVSRLRPQGQAGDSLERLWKAHVARLRPGAVAYLLLATAFASVFILFLSQSPEGRPRTTFLTAFGFLIALLASILGRHLLNLALLLDASRTALIVAVTQRGRWWITRPVRHDFAVLAVVATFAIVAARWRTPFAQGAMIWLTVECACRALWLDRRVRATRPAAGPAGGRAAESPTVVIFVPQVYRRDVVRVIRRDFPNSDPGEVLSILDRQGSRPGGRNRIHLAILKLSGGDVQKLSQLARTARTDLRNVILPAENPRMWGAGSAGVAQMSPAERARLREDDWQEYRQWLSRR
jgi:hypothetical protein